MGAQSVMPKSDSPNQGLDELRWLVDIANSLPPHVDPPDWGTPQVAPRTKYTQDIVAMARRSVARWGLDWDRNQERVEARKFQAFLDSAFPREQAQFAAFRNLIDGPDLEAMAAREWGLETISAPHSSLNNYRFIVTTRRTLRGGAELCARIAARVRARRKKARMLHPLHICIRCGKLFIPEKGNNVYCDPKKCGAAFRQARKRDRDRQRDEYEVRRQQKMARNEQRKVKKGA